MDRRRAAHREPLRRARPADRDALPRAAGAGRAGACCSGRRSTAFPSARARHRGRRAARSRTRRCVIDGNMVSSRGWGDLAECGGASSGVLAGARHPRRSAFDPPRDYPLGDRRPELVSTPGGHAARGGHAGAACAPARSHPRAARRRPRRCCARRPWPTPPGARRWPRTWRGPAELGALPDDEMLEIYTALRPRRATADELGAIAPAAGRVAAPRCAAFVREAAGRTRQARAAAEADVSDEPRGERFRVRAERAAPARDADRPEPSLGLVAMDGPGDPVPSLVVTDGVVELDGKPRDDFDTLDRFIAAPRHRPRRRGRGVALEDSSSRAGWSTSTCPAPSSCGSPAGSRRRSWRG